MLKHLACFITVLFMLHVSAQAAETRTPVTESTIRDFKASCLLSAQNDGIMAPLSMVKYCTCTSMFFGRTILMEDIADLNANNEKSAAAANKILAEANAPCAQYPIHDIVEKRCAMNNGTQAACACVGRKTDNFFRVKTTAWPRLRVQKNPVPNDFLSPLLNDPEFQSMQQKATLACINAK